MSRATEIAEQEAAEAEAPRGDEAPEQPEQLEQPEQPAEPEGLNEAQADAIFKSLQREHERHAREFEKRDGGAVGLVPCPACNDGASPIAGYIFPDLPEPMQTARRQAVNEALGGSGPVEYRTHPSEVRCEVCDGLGMLHTGSRVPNQENLPCTGCGGTGHRPKLTPAAAVPAPPFTATPPGSFPQGNGSAATDDQWGRPLGHPHYNVPPAQVTG